VIFRAPDFLFASINVSNRANINNLPYTVTLRGGLRPPYFKKVAGSDPSTGSGQALRELMGAQGHFMIHLAHHIANVWFTPSGYPGETGGMVVIDASINKEKREAPC
jgi:hypothetical protein